MESRVCVDTDIIIDHLRGRENGAEIFAKILTEIPLPAISVITYFELQCGISSSKEAQIIQDCLAPFEIIPFDIKEAETAAQIYKVLKKSGNLIGIKDILIAGTVIANNLYLATKNRRDFERVPGLNLWSL